VIGARSAIPWNSKRTILTQEVLRILLNCSTDLPWEMAVGHLEQMMARMQYSGYDKKFRIEVLRSALKAYERKKWQKQHKWYKKGGYESVIFIAATPNSTLKRQYERERSGVWDLRSKWLNTIRNDSEERITKIGPFSG
jgi:hypothetical protein